MFMTRYLPDRYCLLPLVGVAALLAALVTRIALVLRGDVAASASALPGVFGVGALFDVASLVFGLAPLALWLALAPDRLARSRIHQWLAVAGFGVAVFVFEFVVAAEWVFWDEFGGRFNFIAVDYLIYTHEVIGNVWESYPVGKILTALAAVAVGAAAMAAGRVRRWSAAPLARRPRLIGAALALAVPMLVGAMVDSTAKNRFGADPLNDLAGNGVFEFFAAARSNDLDYLRHYATMPENEALSNMRRMLEKDGGSWRRHSRTDTLRTVVVRPQAPMNVILISVESLGAEFLGAWGDRRGLTPRLDALARDSLMFTNVYATGNRTVRGLEALALAVPPTPGQSILKRPRNEHMFTLGDVMEQRDYESFFFYGGYGYFDNMNAFFSTNDYAVADRTAIPSDRIHHENVWGVADEDLFAFVSARIDAHVTAARGKPFFAHVMTTSNHRPYTYPEGRVDIPSGSGREGAVKYTDWAVGRFIDEARRHAWFDNTIFVITADHGANARGSAEIPIEQYRIPLLIYAPAKIRPRRVDRLMSQIDVPPTLLGLMGLSYESKFFGYDMMHLPEGEERAFVANYQTLGYLRDGRLVLLRPRREVAVRADAHAPAFAGGKRLSDEELVKEAIAWYESAALVLRHGAYADEDHEQP